MRRNSIVGLVVLIAAFVGCVADIPDSHPTDAQVQAPVPVVIQLPQPAGPAPAAPTNPPPASNNGAPAANPTTPPSSPAPSAGGCGLGRGPGDGEGCPRTSGMFIDDMDRAHSRVQSKQPNLLNGGRVPTQNWNAYYAAMIEELTAMGYCAMFDGHDIAVKNTNAFNEQYHVILSNGSPRTGEGSYRATCRPAWF
jgi:hypothetical protein